MKILLFFLTLPMAVLAQTMVGQSQHLALDTSTGDVVVESLPQARKTVMFRVSTKWDGAATGSLRVNGVEHTTLAGTGEKDFALHLPANTEGMYLCEWVLPTKTYTRTLRTTGARKVATSASAKLDTLQGVRTAESVEALRYSSRWTSGASSVRVLQNGETSLYWGSGEGQVNWAPPSWGVWTLTHQSLSANGTVLETLTAQFEPPTLDMTATVSGYTGTYDGAAHGVTVATNATSAGATIRYATAQAGPFADTPIMRTDNGSQTIWVEISKPGYHTLVKSATVTINRKSISGATVTLGSGLTYTGAQQTQGVSSVKVGTLTATYTVSGNTGTNAGSYTLTVTGTGNYTGTVTKGWSIAKASVAAPALAPKVHTGATLIADVPPSSRYTVVANAGGVAPGTYPVVLSLVDGNNYRWSDDPSAIVKTVFFEITKDLTWKDLEGAFGEIGEVTSDGDGWKVTLTNDVGGVLEVGDGLGRITLDLKGKNLIGTAGAAGDAVSVPGGDGEPAIRIKAGGGSGSATQLTIVDSVPDDTDDVIGGKGGDGTPGGNGGPGVRVDPAAKAGVKVNIGASVGIRGGKGGRDLSGNDHDGRDGVAVEGEIGTNEGTVVKVAVEPPVLVSKEYTGGELSPDIPENACYAIMSAGGLIQPGNYPVMLTLTDTANYRWTTTDSASVYVWFEIREPHYIVIGGETSGGEAGAANAASRSFVYDGLGHGIEVSVTSPAGATVRYARTEAGPYAAERPLVTNVCAAVDVWYEVSAPGYNAITNRATVTVTPRNLRNAAIGSLTFADQGGVRTPVATLVDDLGNVVSADDVVFTWKIEDSGRTTLSFAGRNNYYGTYEDVLARTSFTVTYVVNGGVLSSDSDVFDIGTYYGTRLPAPVKPGYLFDGWYESSSFAPETRVDRNTQVIADDVTLYAKWNRRALWYSDSTFHVEAAAVWNGYILDGERSSGTVEIKVGKPGKNGSSKVSATVTTADAKKVKFTGSTFDGTFKATVGGKTLDVRLFESGLAGTFDGKPIDGARNVFTAKDADSSLRAAQALRRWQGTYVTVLDSGSGYGGLTVAVGSKGKTTVKGTLADGTKVSGKSQLMVGERECALSFSWMKKGARVSFLVWFCEDGTVEISNLHDPAVVAVIANQKSGPYLKSGAMFRIDGAAVVSKLGAGILDDLLPDGLPVVQTGAKWILAKPGKVAVKKGVLTVTGDNPSGLKLSYTLKTSSFKGSFAAYSVQGGKLKKVKVTVNGVVMGGKGWGTATVKKPACIWPVTIE